MLGKAPVMRAVVLMLTYCVALDVGLSDVVEPAGQAGNTAGEMHNQDQQQSADFDTGYAQYTQHAGGSTNEFKNEQVQQLLNVFTQLSEDGRSVVSTAGSESVDPPVLDPSDFPPDPNYTPQSESQDIPETLLHPVEDSAQQEGNLQNVDTNAAVMQQVLEQRAEQGEVPTELHPKPLGGLSLEEVQHRLQDSHVLLYANPAVRNTQRALAMLQELDTLLHTWLAASSQGPSTRKRMQGAAAEPAPSQTPQQLGLEQQQQTEQRQEYYAQADTSSPVQQGSAQQQDQVNGFDAEQQQGNEQHMQRMQQRQQEPQKQQQGLEAPVIAGADGNAIHGDHQVNVQAGDLGGSSPQAGSSASSTAPSHKGGTPPAGIDDDAGTHQGSAPVSAEPAAAPDTAMASAKGQGSAAYPEAEQGIEQQPAPGTTADQAPVAEQQGKAAQQQQGPQHEGEGEEQQAGMQGEQQQQQQQQGEGAAADGQAPAGAAAAAPSPPRAAQSTAMSFASEVDANIRNGVSEAAQATYALAALRASGLLAADTLSPAHPGQVVMDLQAAARGGSLPAMYGLMDRFLLGKGVPASCPVALRYAKVAAAYLALEVDREQRYAPVLAPVALRERHHDGGYVAAHDVENGEQVINMEEDMAIRGNVDAQRRMAYRRLVGRGIEADPAGAYQDFQVAAAQGDPYAIFNLGYMHLRGLHVPQNYTAAKEYFEVAAAKGLPSAYNGLGVLAWNGQGMAANLTAAREAFEQGAALNNSDALYNLATMHYGGVGTPVNYTLGVELFERALVHGHWRAPYMLAHAYESGFGVPANCTKAAEVYRRFFADRTTWNDDITNAVKQLDNGDPWGALVRLVLLAEQGSAQAAANAAWLLRRGAARYGGADALSPQAAALLSFKYFERAAQQGHIPSMIEVGHLLLDMAAPHTQRRLMEAANASRQVNASEAVAWYQRAADAGDVEGMYYSAWAVHYGVGGVEANVTHAHQLYTEALNKAGIKSPHALAPLLGLSALRIDRWLLPFTGPHATHRAGQALRHVEEWVLARLPPWLKALLPSSKHMHMNPHAHPANADSLAPETSAAGNHNAAGSGAASGARLQVQEPGASSSGEALIERQSPAAAVMDVLAALLHRGWAVLSAQRGLEGDAADGDDDNLVMTVLLGLLLAVLYLRRRRSQQRMGLAAEAIAAPLRQPERDGQQQQQ